MQSYNERLFSQPIRRFFHEARFKWASRQIDKNSTSISVLELGCHDGRLLDYLKQRPIRYVGLDANWVGGIELARDRFRSIRNYTFVEVHKPSDIQLGDELFNFAVSLETLEHINDEDLDEYFSVIAKHLNGYFLVTIPNEKGPLFLVKWIIKRIIGDSKDVFTYTWREVLYASIGRLDKVKRIPLGHKGFDYHSVIAQLCRQFHIVSIEGRPFGWLPTWLCFTICIIAKNTSVKCGRSRK